MKFCPSDGSKPQIRVSYVPVVVAMTFSAEPERLTRGEYPCAEIAYGGGGGNEE